MLRRFLLIILFSGSSLLFAQQKYLVYFKDKGIFAPERLYKTSQIFSAASQYLSDKSIERRKQVMGNDSFVNYDDVPVYSRYKEEIIKTGIAVDKTLNWFNAVSCYLTNDEYNRIKILPFVEKIEPVRILGAKKEAGQEFDLSLLFSNTPTVNFSTYNYGYSLAQNSLSDVPKAHDAGFNGNGVIIGVLDTGFELTSKAFTGLNLIAQHDFVFNDDFTFNQSGDASDQHNHGTAVLSIMAGMDNGYLIGPAFRASFLLAKTEDVRSEKHIEEDNYAAALEWMEARGVMITSSSLGYNIFDSGQASYTYQDLDGKTTIVTKAAEKAFERGVVTITAAGNEGANSWHYIIAPADGINTIAVGALTSSNTVAGFSSRGPSYDGRIKPDICTQGSEVFHALPLSIGYSSGAGTSYATPMAAGITALLLQAYPHLTNYQVRNIILQSGDNYKTPDNNRGYGLLSAVRALNFPNIKKNANTYVLNKMFIGVADIIPGSVKFYYTVNSVTQTPVNMNYDGVNKYSVSMPLLNSSDRVTFTITYAVPGGTLVDPVSDYYEFHYGELFVYDKSFGARVELPEVFSLYQNFPNPFSGETKIGIDLPYDTNVEVDIYNILGQKIKTLFSGSMSGGKKLIMWNGRNDAGAACPSGVYIYSVKTDLQLEVKKMVLVR